MKYDNPQVPHEVNVSESSHTKTFIRMTIMMILGIVASFICIYLFFRFFSAYIPFSFEQSITENLFSEEVAEASHQDAQKALQVLADKLAVKMNLPPNISVKVHLLDSAEKNAFATLGGHVVLTQGLIDMMPSENALAMVMAHEIGHVKHRDPIVSAGSALTFNLLISVVMGGDVGLVEQTSGTLTQLSFSRTQENNADKAAIDAVKAYYGHTAGAEAFFKIVLDEAEHSKAPIEFLSTHPDTQKRLDRILQSQTGQYKLMPLPETVRKIQKKP